MWKKECKITSKKGILLKLHKKLVEGLHKEKNIHFGLSTIHKVIHIEKSIFFGKIDLCTELSTLSTMYNG